VKPFDEAVGPDRSRGAPVRLREAKDLVSRIGNPSSPNNEILRCDLLAKEGDTHNEIIHLNTVMEKNDGLRSK
jgi:hypothetical protein